MEIAHESVFVSAIRSFCKVFFSIIGLILAVTVALFAYSMFSSPYEPEEKTTLTILPDLHNEAILHSMSSPVVLQINIHGVIGEPSLNTETIQNVLFDSHRGILGKDRIKAVLLHMNTPGGTVTDSDNIYRLVKEYKETYKVPVFVYVDGICASGGMYISSAADKIYASPPSIVGSVGVIFGPFFNVIDGLNRIGIQAKTLTQGLDKDTFSPFRPWKPDEEVPFQPIMTHFYHRFVDIVTAARPHLNKDKLINEYGAKIFDSPKAQELGYVDVANAEYKLALQDLMTAAQIDLNKPYQVVELKARHDWLDAICAQLQTISGHTFPFIGKHTSTLNEPFAYLFTPGGTRL